MFKLILSLLVVISTTIIGFSKAQRLYNRKTVLENFVIEIKKCSTKIRYSAYELSQIFSENFMGYKFNADESFVKQWDKMLKLYDCVLCSNDIKILSAFARNLGTTDTKGELNNIKLYVTLLEDNINEAKKEIEKKSKLYKTLGLSIGITISILLL